MRLAHRHTLENMENFSAVTGLDMVKSNGKVGTICEACVDSKATNLPHPRHKNTTCEVLRLIHTDITGPIDPPSMNGEKYAQILVDGYRGAIWVTSMEARSGTGDFTRNMVFNAQKMTSKK